MTNVNDRRLVAEPLEAWKRARLKIDRMGRVEFGPVSAGGTYGMVEDAECRPLLPPIRGSEPRDRVHQAPQPDCSCGFYATKDRRPPRSGQVALRVELTGTVIVHSRGYRAQHQRVVGIQIPNTCGGFCSEPAVAILIGGEGDVLPSCETCAELSIPFGLSDLAGRAGVDVSWCEPTDLDLTAAATAFTNAAKKMADQINQMVIHHTDTFRRLYEATWTSTDETSGRDGAKIDPFIADETWDAAVAEPVHPLEAKRHRDEARRRRLEQLAGPQRPPRTMSRRGARR